MCREAEIITGDSQTKSVSHGDGSRKILSVKLINGFEKHVRGILMGKHERPSDNDPQDIRCTIDFRSWQLLPRSIMT